MAKKMNEEVKQSIQEINDVLKPLQELNSKRGKMDEELREVSQKIKALKEQLEEQPSFDLLNEIKLLERSYNEYRSMSDKVYEQITAEEKSIEAHVANMVESTIRKIVISEYMQKKKEAERIVKEAAQLILETEQSLLDYRQNAIDEAETIVKDNTSLHLVTLEWEAWRKIRNKAAKPKFLGPALKTSLQDIHTHYYTY